MRLREILTAAKTGASLSQSIYLGEADQRSLGGLQDADAGAVVGLQDLLLGQLLVDALLGGGALHPRHMQLHGQHLILLLLFQIGFLEAFDFPVHHVYLVVSHAVHMPRKEATSEQVKAFLFLHFTVVFSFC